MPGRRPKPTVLKELTGNPGGRPLNKHEPKPPEDDLTCPMTLTPVAQREWERLVPLLTRMRVLTNADVLALGALCVSFGRWVEADEHIRAEGSILVTDKGYLYQSPWLGVANTSFDQMRKLLVEFGLTPSSRSKVAALPAKDADSELRRILNTDRGGDIYVEAEPRRRQ